MIGRVAGQIQSVRIQQLSNTRSLEGILFDLNHGFRNKNTSTQTRAIHKHTIFDGLEVLRQPQTSIQPAAARKGKGADVNQCVGKIQLSGQPAALVKRMRSNVHNTRW